MCRKLLYSLYWQEFEKNTNISTKEHSINVRDLHATFLLIFHSFCFCFSIYKHEEIIINANWELSMITKAVFKNIESVFFLNWMCCLPCLNWLLKILSKCKNNTFIALRFILFVSAATVLAQVTHYSIIINYKINKMCDTD